MATQVLMPRQGNTVESCIILSWKKKEGDAVTEGDILCEVETDKATFEVEANASGTLLKILYKATDDVPVLTPIAIIGTPGEDIASLLVSQQSRGGVGDADRKEGRQEVGSAQQGSESDLKKTGSQQTEPEAARTEDRQSLGISPRARRLAEANGLTVSGIAGSGPGGRIIERDVKQVLASQAPLSPAAIEARGAGKGTAPLSGSGIGGRVLAADLLAASSPAASSVKSTQGDFPGPVEEVQVKGIRKLIADRMKASLATTAQLQRVCGCGQASRIQKAPQGEPRIARAF